MSIDERATSGQAPNAAVTAALVVVIGALSAILAWMPSSQSRQTAGAASEAAVQAQAAYERGVELRRTDAAASAAAFRESAQRWSDARAAGAENGTLEFNLGNAAMEAGDVGRAIAAYLRAERFMPGDADLAHNLAHARASVTSSFDRSGGTVLVDSVAGWWHLLPRSFRTGAAWTAWIGFWLALAATAMRPALRTHAAWRAMLGTLLAGWAVFGGTVIADEALAAARPRAVLVEHGIVLRKGNGDGFEPAFVETLGPGVECLVTERRPGWIRVQLPDGRSGWLRASQAVDV
jgi:hypothetical protein